MSVEQPRPKLVDIANAVGVSISTASRALRNDPRVNHETRNRVAQEAQRIDYQSNRTPENGFSYKQSSKNQTHTGGQLSRLFVVMLRPAPRNFYSDALVELLDISRKLNIELEMIDCNPYEIRDALHAAEAGGWDAALVITLANISHSLSQDISSCRLPVVFLNRHIEGITNAVTLDDYAAGVRAARYLASLNHRRIAHLPGNVDSTAVRERSIGFRTGLEMLGLYNSELFVKPLDSEDPLQWTHNAVSHLLGLQNPPTAIWAFCDTIASAALVTARAAGLDVPRDISIMGFDNNPELLNTVLTTFDRRSPDMIRQALALLDSLVKGTVTHPIRVCVVPTLIERASTGPAPG